MKEKEEVEQGSEARKGEGEGDKRQDVGMVSGRLRRCFWRGLWTVAAPEHPPHNCSADGPDTRLIPPFGPTLRASTTTEISGGV